MFKRDQVDSPSSADETRKPDAPREQRPAVSGRSAGPAVIGPSIHVDGKLKGDEDLVIEGKVKGTVELKKNSVTIGANGDVQADIYAHTIYVDGTMNGNLVASERVVIRQSARIRGSVVSPRVSLEDGAQFNGSIDMDAESEVLGKAFSGRKGASGGTGETGGKKANEADKSAPAKPAADKSTGQTLGL